MGFYINLTVYAFLSLMTAFQHGQMARHDPETSRADDQLPQHPMPFTQ
jgi:hypothetical protein